NETHAVAGEQRLRRDMCGGAVAFLMRCGRPLRPKPASFQLRRSQDGKHAGRRPRCIRLDRTQNGMGMYGTHHDGVEECGGVHVACVATLAHKKPWVFFARHSLPNSKQTHYFFPSIRGGDAKSPVASPEIVVGRVGDVIHPGSTVIRRSWRMVIKAAG